MATFPPDETGGTRSFKILDIVTQALQELNVVGQSEALSAGDAAFCLTKFNRLVDAWNADGKYIFAVNGVQYVLTPNLQPHTIGPTGTFQVATRPSKIVNANIILNAGGQSAVREPVTVRDADWWANKRAYAVVGTLPTDLYYEEDQPNGSLYLWIVPTVAYPLELWTWTLVSQGELDTAVSLPQGYLDALVYSLAESVAPAFGRVLTAGQVRLLNRSLDRIFGRNTNSPRLATRDVGMPNGSGNRPTFNWLTGLNRP